MLQIETVVCEELSVFCQEVAQCTGEPLGIDERGENLDLGKPFAVIDVCCRSSRISFLQYER